MDDEFETELTPDQWDVLKNLRNPASRPAGIGQFAIDHLIELELVVIHGDKPVITSRGRKVLIRGSCRLLHDLAA